MKIPFLSYDQLRTRAAAFLDRYHSPKTVPTPIEEIVELGLELDVIPTPGLQQHFDVDAWISRDMTSIYIDDHMFRNVLNRYRFSLAHELAHAVLHQKIYQQLKFDDIASWKIAQADIDEEDYHWLEWQAHAFAGLVLVPPDALMAHFDIAVAKASAAGVSLVDISAASRRMIAGKLAREFDVSTDVINIRLRKDQLWPT